LAKGKIPGKYELHLIYIKTTGMNLLEKK